MGSDNNDNYDDTDNTKPISGVGVLVKDGTSNSGVNEGDAQSDFFQPSNSGVSGESNEDTGVNVPFYGLDSDFGDAPYWNNGTITTDNKSCMLSVIATYSNIDGLHGLQLTPQYGFSRRMKEFGEAGYNATVSELSDNLIGMNMVDMLSKKQITSDVCINTLSYLMFERGPATLKQEDVPMVDPNKNSYQKKNLVHLLYQPTHYLYHEP